MLVILIVILTGFSASLQGTDRKVLRHGCKEKHEVFTHCSGRCDRLCTAPTMRACSKICKPGCICKHGFYRDKYTNQCVRLDDCPIPPIGCKGKNEVFTECSGYCDRLCTLPNSRNCPLICKEGCICKDGFYRDSKYINKCVRLEDCPIQPNSMNVKGNMRNSLNVLDIVTPYVLQ
ncbi:zonadhesin-like [Chrysoperla carnea]|uniref:zonadhesin-like n=1 Tax=Chrysoperla carnea TaxID=189513 RepID=UPI001D081FFD|nr:zonadhesin-like [Chrysoperla carnea]